LKGDSLFSISLKGGGKREKRKKEKWGEKRANSYYVDLILFQREPSQFFYRKKYEK